MVNWDPITAIAGVVCAVAAIAVIPSAYQPLLSLMRKPAKEECERFDWDDIRAGEQMHECAGFCGHRIARHESNTSRCWEKQLSTVFSTSWIRSARIGHRKVPKPTSLPPGRNYICTDAQTIKAFILCSVGCSVEYAEFNTTAMPWGPEYLRDGATHVRIRMFGDSEKIFVAHLEGELKANLTKGDVDGIASGYPPWYREAVTLLGSPPGRRVPSPIKTYSDVARAGWILGVGMSDAQPLEAAPRSKLFSRNPIKRLQDILMDKIFPAFPEENVRVVGAAVARMLTTYTESGISIILSDADGNYVDKHEEIKKFSQADATFAMAIFNSPPNVPLTDDEIAKIRPILLRILSAAFRGSWTVVKAFKNMGSSCDDWPENVKRIKEVGRPGEHGWHWALTDPKQTIYLEDCAGVN